MEALSATAVREIYARISNWGRWGQDDALGTLNYITAAKRREAASLVSHGETVACGRILDTAPSPMNNKPAKHYMMMAGDMAADKGASAFFDEFCVYPHGQGQSHIDAWCHIAHDKLLYNGHPASLVTSTGAKVGDMTAPAQGIVSRAIFLDIAAARGCDFIDAEEPVRPVDLDRAVSLANVEPGEGDIVIYRTGRHERRAALGPDCERYPDGRGHLPGLYADCLEWLHDRRVALIGSDCAHDMLPSPIEGEAIPIHVGTEVYMGMLLLHNLDLSGVRDACSRYGRHEFFFAISPLLVQGGTGSPVNPIAVF